MQHYRIADGRNRSLCGGISASVHSESVTDWLAPSRLAVRNAHSYSTNEARKCTRSLERASQSEKQRACKLRRSEANPKTRTNIKKWVKCHHSPLWNRCPKLSYMRPHFFPVPSSFSSLTATLSRACRWNDHQDAQQSLQLKAARVTMDLTENGRDLATSTVVAGVRCYHVM